jgi:predicted GNAT family acetyltransferase
MTVHPYRRKPDVVSGLSDMQLVDNDDKDCYEGIIDGQVVGVVVYKRVGGRVVIRHTVIEPESRGRGLGGQLVRAVLNDLRERGDTVTNYCGFVADFIAANPEYQSIVDTDRPGVTPSTGGSPG